MRLEGSKVEIRVSFGRGGVGNAGKSGATILVSL
jgi:hypothetical protein